jgi:hypothetical protein
MAYQDDRAAPEVPREGQKRPKVAAAAKGPAPGLWRRRVAVAAALAVIVTGGLAGTIRRLEKQPREASLEPPAPLPACWRPRELQLDAGPAVRQWKSEVPGLLYREAGGCFSWGLEVFIDGRVRFRGDPQTEVRVTGAAVVRLAALGRIYRSYMDDGYECTPDSWTALFYGRGGATVSELDREEIRRLVREIKAEGMAVQP